MGQRSEDRKARPIVQELGRERKCMPVKEATQVLPYAYILNKRHQTGNSYRCRGRENTGRKGWGLEVELALRRRHLASSPQTGSRKRDKRADKDSGSRKRAQEVSKVPVWWLLSAQRNPGLQRWSTFPSRRSILEKTACMLKQYILLCIPFYEYSLIISGQFLLSEF